MNLIPDYESSSGSKNESYLNEIEDNAEFEELDSRELDTDDETENDEDTDDETEDNDNGALAFDDGEKQDFEGDIEMIDETETNDVIDTSREEAASARPQRQVRTVEYMHDRICAYSDVQDGRYTQDAQFLLKHKNSRIKL